jgi:hypothetical protein
MSLPRPYLALDPGTTGALALVAGREVIVVDIPYRRTVVDGRGRRVLDLEALADVCRMLAIFEPILVTEAVAGRRGDDAWSVGELTRSAGAVEAALAACGVPVACRVPPAAWKRALGLTRIPKAQRKTRSLEMARGLWPTSDAFRRAKDHNRAEAALIAHWARTIGIAGLVAEAQLSAPPKPRRRRKSKEATKNVFC